MNGKKKSKLEPKAIVARPDIILFSQRLEMERRVDRWLMEAGVFKNATTFNVITAMCALGFAKRPK